MTVAVEEKHGFVFRRKKPRSSAHAEAQANNGSTRVSETGSKTTPKGKSASSSRIRQDVQLRTPKASTTAEQNGETTATKRPTRSASKAQVCISSMCKYVFKERCKLMREQNLALYLMRITLLHIDVHTLTAEFI